MPRSNSFFYSFLFLLTSSIIIVPFYGLPCFDITDRDCRVTKLHRTEVDVEFGVHTQKEIDYFHNYEPKPGLGTKTPVAEDINGTHDDDILTVVVDFKDSTQPITQDIIGNNVGEFDVTEFGFSENDFQIVADAILAEVQDDFFGELSGTAANENGQELRIRIIEGDIGTPPAGISEFYYVQVGTGLDGPQTGALGVARLSAIRNSAGFGPNNLASNGDVVASVFTDNIQNLGGIIPSNALSSGNLTFTRNAVVGTLSHEIGHALSLSHINVANSLQPSDAPPIMGTGAIDLQSQQRLLDREFSISGMNAQNGNDAVFHIDQLAGAVGLAEVFDGLLVNNLLIVSDGAESGGLTEINQEDSSALRIIASPNSAVPVLFDVFAESPLLDPPSLAVRITSRSNSPNVLQRVELFNFSTGSFDLVSETSVSAKFELTEVEVDGEPIDYVNLGTCQVACRVSYSAIGPVLFFPWAIEVDQVQLEILD